MSFPKIRNKIIMFTIVISIQQHIRGSSPCSQEEKVNVKNLAYTGRNKIVLCTDDLILYVENSD